VELTDERVRHIREAHADEAEAILSRIAETIVNPEMVRAIADGHEMQFARRFDLPPRPRYIVVIVVTHVGATADPVRYWIVTAYTARRLGKEGHRWTAL
jgi:hypothetical protein